jgi:hypothetical protein
MALVGLIDLKSQGHSREPHPVVGGTIRPSRQTIFGWWVIVPVVTAWRCYLVRAAWRRDGVCLVQGDSCLLSPNGVSGACLPLLEQAYLMELDLFPFLLGSGLRRGRATLCCT